MADWTWQTRLNAVAARQRAVFASWALQAIRGRGHARETLVRARGTNHTRRLAPLTAQGPVRPGQAREGNPGGQVTIITQRAIETGRHGNGTPIRIVGAKGALHARETIGGIGGGTPGTPRARHASLDGVALRS